MQRGRTRTREEYSTAEEAPVVPAKWCRQLLLHFFRQYVHPGFARTLCKELRDDRVLTQRWLRLRGEDLRATLCGAGSGDFFTVHFWCPLAEHRCVLDFYVDEWRPGTNVLLGNGVRVREVDFELGQYRRVEFDFSFYPATLRCYRGLGGPPTVVTDQLQFASLGLQCQPQWPFDEQVVQLFKVSDKPIKDPRSLVTTK